MSVSHVPGFSLTTCDACKKTDAEVPFKQAGKMQITHHVLDFQGSPCAGRDMRFDFCDNCLPLITTGINLHVEVIRNRNAPK